MQHDLDPFFTAAMVIPVLTINDVRDAAPLAKALLDGGVSTLEVTLRTPAAFDAIRAIKSQVSGVTVGAGTVTTPELYQKAVEAGSEFIVSPGFNSGLLEQANIYDVPFVPGVSTVSEIMQLYRQGYQFLKFFPAEICGGVEFLKAVLQVMPMLQFCPTGGVNINNLGDYLALKNVACVGGSWLATSKEIKEKEWAVITEKAQSAADVAR